MTNLLEQQKYFHEVVVPAARRAAAPGNRSFGAAVCPRTGRTCVWSTEGGCIGPCVREDVETEQRQAAIDEACRRHRSTLQGMWRPMDDRLDLISVAPRWAAKVRAEFARITAGD